MGFAGIDDGFDLGVGQDAIGDDAGWKSRPIVGLGRRDAGHSRRLHQLGWMSRGTGNTDRLQSVLFINRIGDPAVLGGGPVEGLVGEFDAFRFGKAVSRDGRCCACQIAAN